MDQHAKNGLNISLTSTNMNQFDACIYFLCHLTFVTKYQCFQHMILLKKICLEDLLVCESALCRETASFW